MAAKGENLLSYLNNFGEHIMLKQVNKLTAYCYFNNTGNKDDGNKRGLDSASIYQLSTSRSPEKITFTTDYIDVDVPINKTTIESKCEEINDCLYKTKINEKNFTNFSCVEILWELIGYSGKSIGVEKGTKIDYNELDNARTELKSLKKQLENSKIDIEKYKGKISECSVTIDTDVESVWDTSYGCEVKRDSYNYRVKHAFGASNGSATFIIPGKSDFLKYLSEKIMLNFKLTNGLSSYIPPNNDSYVIYDSVKIVSAYTASMICDNGILQRYNDLIDACIVKIKELRKTLRELQTIYEAAEKKQKEQYAKKINNLIAKNGSLKAARAELKKILKDDGINSFKAKDVISLWKVNKISKGKLIKKYETFKEKYGKDKAQKAIKVIIQKMGLGFKSSEIFEKPKKPKDDDNSGSGNTSNTSNTGAKVGKKRNIKNTIASAAAIVSNKKYDKNIKAIRDAGKSKITEIKNAASTKMENASKVAMDKKNTALIEKNNSIQDINKEAMEKINKIDINDHDAASKIAEIKSDAASKIALAEEKYNNTIKQIDNAKSAEVATIKADLNNKVGRVNQLVSDQVKSLKNSEKSAGVAGVTTAIKSINSKDVASYKMNVTADAVTTSNTNASTSNDSLTSLINEKLKVLNNNSNNVSPSQPSSSESVATEVTPAQNVTQPSSDTSATTATTTSSNYSNNNSSSNVVSDANSVSSNSNVTDSVDSSDNVGSSTSSTTSSSSSTDSSISDVIKPKKVITDITADDSSSSSSVSSSNGGSSKAVIPAVLGVGAVGAAAVAGVRYVKGRKQNEDIDDSYDDENNNIDQSDDSVYGDDVYSGPAGSEYTDISEFATDDEGNSDSLETNEYIDADYLNSDSSDDDFSDDEVMKELNRE